MAPPVPDIKTLLQSGGESYGADSSSAALVVSTNLHFVFVYLFTSPLVPAFFVCDSCDMSSHNKNRLFCCIKLLFTPLPLTSTMTSYHSH